MTKIAHGAWFPLSVGLVVAIVMITWSRGRVIVTRNRSVEEGPLEDFLGRLRMADPPDHRVRNVAVYLSPGMLTTPLAMRADVERHGVFHDRVLIVSVDSVSVPHVVGGEQFVVQTLGSGLFKIVHVTLRPTD